MVPKQPYPQGLDSFPAEHMNISKIRCVASVLELKNHSQEARAL